MANVRHIFERKMKEAVAEIENAFPLWSKPEWEGTLIALVNDITSEQLTRHAMRAKKGNQIRAAAMLGICRGAIHRICKKYKIPTDRKAYDE